MYKKIVGHKNDLHEAMNALDVLDKTYTITKTMVKKFYPLPSIAHTDSIIIREKDCYFSPEWTITEVVEQQEVLASLHNGECVIPKEKFDNDFCATKKSSSVGDLTVNVNIVSNIEDFSEKLTKEFENAIEHFQAMISRPLSDYLTVNIDVDNAGES